MGILKEIAKFASGAEAFHALVHGYFWFTNTTLIVFRIKQTPTWQMWRAVINGGIAILLAVYAWRPFGRRPA